MSRPATSRLKVNAPLGRRPSLENCLLAELSVDHAYQRSIENESSKTLIRKIAMFWDWSLFHPLSVARREDGSLWVVDGQHRLEAAKLRRDMHDLPCVVMAYESAADEAASFVAMNVQRRALSALDLFRAAQAAGDDTAAEITELLNEAGMTLAPHTNFTAWKPRMIANISGIRSAHRKFGRRIALQALQVLVRAWPEEVLRYGGTLFGGLVEFLDAMKADNAFDIDRFVMMLSARPHAQWAKEIGANAARDGIRRQAAGVAVFGASYSEAARLVQDKLEAEECDGCALPLPVSPQQVPAQIRKQPTVQSAPKTAIGMQAFGKRWCDQCDMKVSMVAASGCKSRYCTLRRTA